MTGDERCNLEHKFHIPEKYEELFKNKLPIICERYINHSGSHVCIEEMRALIWDEDGYYSFGSLNGFDHIVEIPTEDLQ